MTRTILSVLLIAFFGLSHAIAQHSEIDSVLSDFHLAASEADYDRYFGHLAEESIFMGTDMSERWTKNEFQDYAKPHFDSGRGWTYVHTDRNIYLAEDAKTAWFDEILVNEKLGNVRGTGALSLDDDSWKIVQYHLTLPVPNDLIYSLVEMIREQSP